LIFLSPSHLQRRGELAKRYFGLLAALESLFTRHVDLVEPEAIRNPYFLQGIQPSRTLLHDAA